MTQTLANQTLAAQHPLDALTAEEVSAAVQVLRDAGAHDVLFPLVTLHEPPKAEVLAHRAGDPVDRRVEFLEYDRKNRKVYRVVVSATHRRIVASQTYDGQQPLYLLMTEFFAAIGLVKSDQRFIDAMAARGVDDLELVQIDPWPAGRFDLPYEEGGRRLCRAVAYVRHSTTDNGYAHPVDNLVAVVDLDELAVLEVIDDGPVPIPQRCENYDAEAVGPARQTLKRVDITQPDGPSFTLDGNHLTWDRWDLRFSLHPIDGLVLHQVTWRDGDVERPVLYRAGLAEMVVPYASTAPTSWWKNAFDAGEMSIGKMANQLVLGCDCVGDITYVDALMVDEFGNPYTLTNAICLHEEDYGVLWKHTDMQSGHVETRRSRRMVLNWTATVGNYEYGFSWHLYLDGRIELMCRLTGIMQTEAAPPLGEPTPHGVRVSPEVLAPHHQHLFCMRLDLDVDGPDNAVYEVDAMPLPPGRDNPHGTAWTVRETLLTRESAAMRPTDSAHGRYWKVVNRSKANGVGGHPGYALMPGYGPTMLAQPDSKIGERARFAHHALWVTPYAPDECHAAGDFPSQQRELDGLPRWTQANRDLVDTDVVLWHVFGATHIARPEDWPVMPVEYTGFWLKPIGFFDRNPALDVPESPGHEGHCHT